MGYGYNYSVKETSDVDMQLIVTPETVSKLKELDFFEPSELEKAITGYLEGVYKQFSLVFQKDGVSMECHFWDLTAFNQATTYQTSETKRLRLGIDTPSTDHGFSFARDESGKVTNVFGEKQRYDQAVKGVIVSNGAIHDTVVNLAAEYKM